MSVVFNSTIFDRQINSAVKGCFLDNSELLLNYFFFFLLLMIWWLLFHGDLITGVHFIWELRSLASSVVNVILADDLQSSSHS